MRETTTIVIPLIKHHRETRGFLQISSEQSEDLSSLHQIHHYYMDLDNPGPSFRLTIDEDPQYTYEEGMILSILIPLIPLQILLSCSSGRH